MFTSFTSFLPSLHLPGANERNGPTNQPAFNPVDTVEEQQAEVEAENIDGRRSDEEGQGKKGKTKSPNETFIFVRPPPAKSNHPLNLQVQLVPPAQPSQRPSTDSEPDTPVSTSTLTRTSSNRSEAPSYGSTASLASTSTTSSGRRTIIPLYNLQAHNVMTNVIVDAGTDAKIAKFQRRGIELIDLALLEPVEVWGERNRPAKPSRPVTPDPTSTTAASSTTSLPSTTHSHSVASSNQGSNPSLQRESSPSVPPIKQRGLTEPKRNIFGKMFRKGKEGAPPGSPTTAASPLGPYSTKTPTQSTPNPEATPTPTQLTPQARRTIRPVSSLLTPLRDRSVSPSKRSNIGLGLTVPSQEFGARRSSIDLAPVPGSPNPSATGSTAGQDEKLLRPPVLGIQPTLSFSYTPSGSTVPPAPLHASNLDKAARALMYVWFVRRWFKQRADEEDNGPLLSVVRHVKRASNISSGSGNGVQGGPGEEGVEVRFEWKRSNKKPSKEKERGRRPRTARSTRSRKDSNVIAANEEGVKEKDFEPSPSTRNKRLSVASHHSVSTNVSASEEGHNSPYMRRPQEGAPREGGNGALEDDGEDSDPEDSETPWVCTLKIRRTGQGLRSTASNTSVNRPGSRNGSIHPPATPPQVLRIKVGTLSPTPHHPKVVGMLKVPFPLPDIEVERMGVVKRPMGPPGVRPPPSQWPGTTLTAEEIKDVVCSTGLWLVVREGFGGVGKVSRKGDGWRIRA